MEIVLKLPTMEAYSEPFQASKRELSERVVNAKKLQTIFTKTTISEAWQGPKSTSKILNINRYLIFVVLIQAVKIVYSIKF